MAKKQKDLDELIRKGEPVSGVSFGDGLTFTSSAAQIARGAGTWVFRYRIGGVYRLEPHADLRLVDQYGEGISVTDLHHPAGEVG